MASWARALNESKPTRMKSLRGQQDPEACSSQARRAQLLRTGSHLGQLPLGRDKPLLQLVGALHFAGSLLAGVGSLLAGHDKITLHLGGQRQQFSLVPETHPAVEQRDLQLQLPQGKPAMGVRLDLAVFPETVPI